ncbi:MAG: hypothetical protein ABIJ00_07420 [Candidatus Eisenbacteria bacterium]
MGKLATGFLTGIVLLGLQSLCLADDTYLTNLELVERAVRAAVDSMDVAPPGSGRPNLQIKTGSGEDALWLLDNVLKGRLIAMGWRVQAGGDGSAEDSSLETGYLLDLRITDLDLNYGRSWRRYVLVGKIIERIARVSFYYELVDRSDGQILASSNARAEVRDNVPASMLPLLSDSEYGFASPEMQKGQWDRYLEGGLVVAIIGVLIYLFYSNKTAS